MDKLATPLLEGKAHGTPTWHKGAAAVLALALFSSGVAVGRVSATQPVAQPDAAQPFMHREDVALPAATALAASEKLTPVNNDCCNLYSKPKPEAPATFDCPAFVIKSTDDTWHTRDWATTSWAIDTYFIPEWQSVRAWGTHIEGRDGLRQFMADWLGGFPDVFIRVADIFCDGNDEAGYKTTMPYVLTATHTGWSKAWGEPTGKKVQYHGIANCFVKKNVTGGWQYTFEWDVGDTASFFTVLNRSMVPHPDHDLIPTEDCTPLFDWGTGKMNWKAKTTWGAHR